ncbi:hypothetical protein ABFS83_04G203300 [Erythranthe nasuta]
MNMEISEDFSGCSNIHQIIVKGKRAKRPRPSSSASSAAAAAAGGDSNSLVSSPATSSSIISTSTEEDEDMANCLILLAQGGGGSTEGKFSSRRFPEMAATAAEGKIGIYVYECKTCSRTFPSFQALGGHRASHKKPKPPAAAAADVDRKKPPPPAPIDRTAEYAPATPSTQFPKTHECSICGSEFASGQALGGHMRRHRSAATNTNTTSSSDIIDAGEKTRNMLELDLNLPAPPEDDRREMNFHRFTPNKQPRLVFSAAALVDCHY